MVHRTSYILIATTVLAVLWSPVGAADYYSWTDEEGNVHISDSVSAVPERYRDQIRSRRFQDEEKGDEPAAVREAPGGGGEVRPEDDRAPGDDAAAAKRKPAKRYVVKYKDREGAAKRVIVQARINGTVIAPVAIDTGAPGTIISLPLARKLGLFENEHGRLLVTARGIGGDAPAVRTFIDTIEIGGAKSEFVPTTIVEELSPSFQGLLGLDFVSNYTVTIDSVKRVVVFEERPPDPEHFAGRDREWWTGLFSEFGSYRADWQRFSDHLERKIKASLNSTNNPDIQLKELADEQCREADKLLDRLNAFASEHSVPVNWRRF